MNREIKFRAWFNEMQAPQMIYPHLDDFIYWDGLVAAQLDICVYKNMEISYIPVNGTRYPDQLGELSDTLWDAPNSTLMQFTGMKDRAGNDVYEGDIISHQRESYKPYVVEYNERTGSFTASGYGINTNVGQCVSMCSLTVVGNIFENPELLK
jgi:uncharacterized phage protein (TIGR01671 family)